MQQQTSIRKDQKAGTWYTDDPNTLKKEFSSWLAKASQTKQTQIKNLKAIIGPHAGLRFCGATGAHSYQHLTPKKTVFLLGPSHYSRFSSCGLTPFSQFKTPLGNIEIDQQITQQILKNQQEFCQKNQISQPLFQVLQPEVDEQEHSLELHISWIQNMLQGSQFKLVPIMVGMIDYQQQKQIGKFLSQYFDDENTVFVISSDFAHWGERFRYTYFDKSKGEIWKSIQHVDKQGMDIIEKHDPEGFNNYLAETENTICGRRPIGILLQIIQNSKYKQQLKTKFLDYSQSSQCQDFGDSSVSYAASVTYLS